MTVIDRVYKWTEYTRLNKQVGDPKSYVCNITEELGELLDGYKKNDENEIVDAIADIMIFSMTELVKKEYDIEKVLDEVLKVIESRKGEWSDKHGKWMKDKSPEAQKLWYSPRYDLCKEL